MEDKYLVSLSFERKEFGERFLVIEQGKNKIFIPYYKIKKTIAGIQFILEDMEEQNG